MEMQGELYEAEAEVTMKWKIKNFSSLSLEANKRYFSPTFHFSSASWCIRINPNGSTENNSENWISLYLIKVSKGIPVTVHYSISIINVDGKKISELNSNKTFDNEDNGWGRPKFILRSEVLEKKSELLPSDVLTVVCTLKHSKQINTAGSLFNRYEELSNNMKEIYKNPTRTDVVFQVSGQNIPAHRMILEKRSPVFAAMFSHDMKENQTGEISIDDTEKSTMDMILKYLYSGQMENLTTENVLPIYAAAEKYDVKVVKDICTEFITRNLSDDWVCDVIKFTDLHENKEISRHAREYIKENARSILKTEKWKIFAKENSDIVLELFGSVLLSLLPE